MIGSLASTSESNTSKTDTNTHTHGSFIITSNPQTDDDTTTLIEIEGTVFDLSKNYPPKFGALGRGYEYIITRFFDYLHNLDTRFTLQHVEKIAVRDKYVSRIVRFLTLSENNEELSNPYRGDKGPRALYLTIIACLSDDDDENSQYTNRMLSSYESAHSTIKERERNEQSEGSFSNLFLPMEKRIKFTNSIVNTHYPYKFVIYAVRCPDMSGRDRDMFFLEGSNFLKQGMIKSFKPNGFGDQLGQQQQGNNISNVISTVKIEKGVLKKKQRKMMDVVNELLFGVIDAKNVVEEYLSITKTALLPLCEAFHKANVLQSNAALHLPPQLDCWERDDVEGNAFSKSNKYSDKQLLSTPSSLKEKLTGKTSGTFLPTLAFSAHSLSHATAAVSSTSPWGSCVSSPCFCSASSLSSSHVLAFCSIPLGYRAPFCRQRTVYGYFSSIADIKSSLVTLAKIQCERKGAAQQVLDLTVAKALLNALGGESVGKRRKQLRGGSGPVVKLISVFSQWLRVLKARDSKEKCSPFYVVQRSSGKGSGLTGRKKGMLGHADGSFLDFQHNIKLASNTRLNNLGGKEASTLPFSDFNSSVTTPSTAIDGNSLLESEVEELDEGGTVKDSCGIDFQLVPETYGPVAEQDSWRIYEVTVKKELATASDPAFESLLGVLAKFEPELHISFLECLSHFKEKGNEAHVILAKYFSVFVDSALALYTKEPQVVSETVVSLITSLERLVSITSFYRDNQERLTLLCLCISNQIIICCKRAIQKPGPLWEQSENILLLQRMLTQFNDSIDLARRFRKELLCHESIVSGLDKLILFGRLELFCARLNKMKQLFGCILTYRSIAAHNYDGIYGIMNAFTSVYEEIRRQVVDCLDYTKPTFDKTFLEFQKKMADIDRSLQVYINFSFEKVTNTVNALKLLQQYEKLMHRDILRPNLQAKYLTVCQKYGTDVENIQRLYERQKQDPPQVRNVPPVSNRILWSRQLLRQIEEPMNTFKSCQAFVFHQRDIMKVIRLYNRVASTLVRYELFWVDAWQKSVEVATEGLHATLLVQNPYLQGQLVVNFDRILLEVVKEAQWMKFFGVKLPSKAVTLVKYRDLSLHVARLEYILQYWYSDISKKIDFAHERALDEVLDDISANFSPALTSITWSSTKVEFFLEDLTSKLIKVDQLVSRLNTVAQCRLEPALRELQNTIILLDINNIEKMEEINKLVATQNLTKIDQHHNNLVAEEETATECGLSDDISNEQTSSAVWVDRQGTFSSFSGGKDSSPLFCSPEYFLIMQKVFVSTVSKKILVINESIQQSTLQLCHLIDPEWKPHPQEERFELNSIYQYSHQHPEGMSSFADKKISTLSDIYKYSSLSPFFEKNEIITSAMMQQKQWGNRPWWEWSQQDSLLNMYRHYNRRTFQAILQCIISNLLRFNQALGVELSSSHYDGNNLGVLKGEQNVNKKIEPASGSVGLKNSIKTNHNNNNNNNILTISIDLVPPDVIFCPSLSELESTLHKCAALILNVLTDIDAWDYLEPMYPQGDNFSPFSEELRHNKDVMKAGLLLSSSIFGLSSQLSEFISFTFSHYRALWENNPAEIVNNITENRSNEPSFSNIEIELAYCRKIEDEINVIDDIVLIGCVRVDCTGIKHRLLVILNRWRYKYGQILQKVVNRRLTSLHDKVDTIYKKLIRSVGDNYIELSSEMETLALQQYWDGKTHDELQYVYENAKILEFYGVGHPLELQDKVFEIKSKWKKATGLASDRRYELSQMQPVYKKGLAESIRAFSIDIICFRNNFEINGPLVEGISAQEGVERVRKFQKLLSDKMRRWKMNIATEDVFCYERHLYPELALSAKEMFVSQRLYGLYVNVSSNVAKYRNLAWQFIDYNSIVKEMGNLLFQLKRLPFSIKKYDAYVISKGLIETYLDLEHIVEQLSQECIKERHWNEIMQICNNKWPADLQDLKLSAIVDAGLLEHKDEIIDLAVASAKEGDIEIKIKNIALEWKKQQFFFANYKLRGPVTLKDDRTAIMHESLEGTLVVLGSLLASKFVGPCRSEVQIWMRTLATVNEAMGQILQVQQAWLYLEAVFCNSDIMKQLPQASKRFAMIDKQWAKFMMKAAEVGFICDFCTNNDNLRGLPYLNDQLEICQKALSVYLEQKRDAFPRFYFASDAVLLELLSQGTNLAVLQSHLPSVFDGIHTVITQPTSENPRIFKITHMISAEGESVSLLEPVTCVGNVEIWLGKLCSEMQRTIRVALCKAVADWGDEENIVAGNSGVSVNDDKEHLKQFLHKYPSQIVLTVLQIRYTAEVTATLSNIVDYDNDPKSQAKRKKMLSKYLISVKEVLAEEARGQSLSSKKKIHIESLTTMAVHNLDIWEIFVKRAKNVDDFDWIKQLRFYWNKNNTHNNRTNHMKVKESGCVLQIVDVDMPYCYEYLGVKERLCVTPLTDRCYITLSQALAMFMGGSPVGPAGTGKTETVKDLGRSAGKYVVVFNCSEQWDARGLGKVFKGLAQSGSWGCFDEFNRITLSVLSVISQQIALIFQALRQHRSTFTYPCGNNAHCKLMSSMGIFMTMNPGYAGRTELPENLKVLFRNVGMMAPDCQVIMRTKLAACGYKQEIALTRKFNLLYTYCKQMLSNQCHYDFGLRNILSVLRSAGDALRMATNSSEDAVFMKCVKDINVCRLIRDDVPVFLSLLNNIFLGMANDKNQQQLQPLTIEAALKKVCRETQKTPSEGFITKCLQIYATKLVRHGIMVIGPAMAGKSCCTTTLISALCDTEARLHKEVRMNPKAITASQMFGYIGKTSGDWVDGVFSTLWRRCNKENNIIIWLICDGPIDTLWIESLNTVLDDNKLLTLANGDRILMSSSLKMCFEAEDLMSASPATISRAGIIYISLDDIDWEPILQSLIESNVRREGDVGQSKQMWSLECGNLFFTLAKTYLPGLFKIVVMSAKTYLGIALQHYVSTMMQIATPFFEEFFSQRNSQKTVMKQVETVTNMVFWYSASWSIAGSLDAPDREFFFERTLPLMEANCPPFPGGFDFPTEERNNLSLDQSQNTQSPVSSSPLFRDKDVSLLSLRDFKSSSVRSSTRNKAGNVIRQKIENINALLPSSVNSEKTVAPTLSTGSNHPLTIFDCYPNVKDLCWESWEPCVPLWQMAWDPSLPYINVSQVFVPTKESTIIQSLLKIHFDLGTPVMLVGTGGMAKTITIERFLASTMQGDNEEVYAWQKISISRVTTPQLLQSAIDNCCEKRMGNIYGPKRNKQLALLLDDVNMSCTNEWGDQPTCELLRQLIECGGIFSLSHIGQWIKYVDMRFFGSMTINTNQMTVGGASPGARTAQSDSVIGIPKRFMRHFAIYAMPFPHDTTFEYICGSILNARFWSVSHIVGYLSDLVKATLSLWRSLYTTLLPTPTRSYYSFDFRDIMRVVQGLLMCPLRSVPSPFALLQIWRHECTRALCDKLCLGEDVQFFESTLAQCYKIFWEKIPIRFSGPTISGNNYNINNTGSKYFYEEKNKDNKERKEIFLANFCTKSVTDPITGEELEQPRLYEIISDKTVLVNKIKQLLTSRNELRRETKLDIILFDYALRHLLRISRILGTPRGSVLLLGLVGSGKQSLTRLAAYTQGQHVFSPTITSQYSLDNWLNDLRTNYIFAGIQGPCTFLVSQSQMKEESFFEYLNLALSGGDVPGFFSVDEKESTRATISHVAKHIARKEFEDSEEWLWNFFINRVKNNLHFVLCFSPGTLFSRQVSQFPGLIASCTVDFFFAWPENALFSVVVDYTTGIDISGTDSIKAQIPSMFAKIHRSCEDLCEIYFKEYRQRVYTTPEVFLTFLKTFTNVYVEKKERLKSEHDKLLNGLKKLRQAGEDVKTMRKILNEKEAALRESQAETELIVRQITMQRASAEQQTAAVRVITERMAEETATINIVKTEAERDLQTAQPAVIAARLALDQITATDIKTLKAMQRPPEMVRRIFDGVCILLHCGLDRVTMVTGGGGLAMADSWVTYGRIMCSRTDLLDRLRQFNVTGKDQVNDETCELLLPYLWQPGFTYERARAASGNIAGLCTWVGAMSQYRAISKFVAPKIDALNAAEARMHIAMTKLTKQNKELEAVQAALDACTVRLNEAEARKDRLEKDAQNTKRRMAYATALIEALTGEKVRWEKSASHFQSAIERLLGDTVLAAAMITYGGPYNPQYRTRLMDVCVKNVLNQRSIPFSSDFDFTFFLVNEQTIADWQMEGLPMDDHSAQNALIMKYSLLFPLLVDPQAQGIQFLKKHLHAQRDEKGGLLDGSSSTQRTTWRGGGHDKQFLKETEKRNKGQSEEEDIGAESEDKHQHSDFMCIITNLDSREFISHMKRQLSSGAPFIVENVQLEKKPALLLSLVEQKKMKVAGKKSLLCMSVLGEPYEYAKGFKLYMRTAESFFQFEPEIFAKVAVIDFTVTHTGLEQQLLARTVLFEKPELEKERVYLVAEINSNEQELHNIENYLLQQLNASEGSLVDDETLIINLKQTKGGAAAVKKILQVANKTRGSIFSARQKYAPIAARGAFFFFIAMELAQINYCYQLSLERFIDIFDRALEKAPLNTNNDAIRITNINEMMGYLFFIYVGRGIFEKHKPILSLLIALKIEMSNGSLTHDQFCSFTKGGIQYDTEEFEGKYIKPCSWIALPTWRNMVALAETIPKFKHISEIIVRYEEDYKNWINSVTPEMILAPISHKDRQVLPGFASSEPLTPFEKLFLVRAFREDRTLIAAHLYTSAILGPHMVEVPPYDLNIVVEEALCFPAELGRHPAPIVFLLSTGSDPSALICHVANRQKRQVQQVSMGQGQEAIAMQVLESCRQAGNWALFQNCHLGIFFLEKLLEWLLQSNEEDPQRNKKKKRKSITQDKAGVGSNAPSNVPDHLEFRVFITTEPTRAFPSALLLKSIKLTNEPPEGLSSSMNRVATWINSDAYDAFPHRSEWRPLLFCLCYIHSLLLERKRYGIHGWAGEYQFSEGDFFASLNYLKEYFLVMEKGGSTHKDQAIGGGVVSLQWKAICYMIGEIHYGGRVTISEDRLLLKTIMEHYFKPENLTAGVFICPELNKFPVRDCSDLATFRNVIADDFTSLTEPPQVVGLFANVEMQHRIKTTSDLLNTILAIQPAQMAKPDEKQKGKRSTTSSPTVLLSMEPTREEVLLSLLSIMLDKIPKSFHATYLREKRNSCNGDPLTIFFCLEAQRVSQLITSVRASLRDLKMALNGSLSLSSDLLDMSDELYNGLLPKAFAKNSWTAPSFSLWFQQLLKRFNQTKEHLMNDIGKMLPYYNISLIFNPQGFINSITQGICCMHAAEGWLLDKMEVHFTPTKITNVNLLPIIESTSTGTSSSSNDGSLLVSGFFLEGASWDAHKSRLRAPLSKEIYHEMPLMKITAVQKQQLQGTNKGNGSSPVRGLGSPTNGREKEVKNAAKEIMEQLMAGATCISPVLLAQARQQKKHKHRTYKKVRVPVFILPTKGDNTYVCDAELATDVEDVNVWVLRGIALLCRKS